MYVAVDSNGKRIYANDSTKYVDCFCPCPDCKERLIHKQGTQRKFFSHKKGSKCEYANDKDSMSEWHIRMQEFFSKEKREVYIWNKEKTEYKRADIYIPEKNMVLEFQHSPIEITKFWNRTLFYLRNGIRVVWLYDESNNRGNYGKFREYQKLWLDSIYKNKWYKWLNKPRPYVNIKSYSISEKISICVYTGTEGDCFHRITECNFVPFTKDKCIKSSIIGDIYLVPFEYVQFSLRLIHMEENMDVEQFFSSDGTKELSYVRDYDGQAMTNRWIKKTRGY